MSRASVHGCDTRESERLHGHAGTHTGLLHDDTSHRAGSLVPEAGCGDGARTVTLVRRDPTARLASVDASPDPDAETPRSA